MSDYDYSDPLKHRHLREDFKGVCEDAKRLELELTRLREENARQAAEIERKNEALKPFAARADFIDADEADDFCAWHPAVGNPVSIGDLRNARTALTQETTDEGR